MRQTSLAAYAEIRKEGVVSAMQTRVLVTISLYPGLTDLEIAEKLGERDPNRIRPRRNELVARGLIYEAETRKCTVSGRSATTWRAL